jgi:type II secretory pathway pseudopilin PulG
MRQHGFSYLLVIFMVSIIAMMLLAGRAVEMTEQQRDRERELLFIGRQFQAALASYAQSGGGSGLAAYPISLDDLLEDKRYPMVKRHLRKIFVDPMTNSQDWGLQMVGERIVGIYSRSQTKPLKQAGFDPDLVGFAGASKYSDWVFGWQLQNIPAH